MKDFRISGAVCLSLCFALGIVLFSCSKELSEADIVDQRSDNTAQEEVDLNFQNFYSLNYVSSGYGITVNELQTLPSVDVSQVLNKYTAGSGNWLFAFYVYTYYGSPCWDCTISRMINFNGMEYFITPVINLEDNSFNSLILTSVGAQSSGGLLIDRMYSAGVPEVSALFDDYEAFFSSHQSWNLEEEVIELRGCIEPEISCNAKCPNGHPIAKCRHCRDCNNQEDPDDDGGLSTFLWGQLIGSTHPIFPGFVPPGNNSDDTSGPEWTGTEDDPFLSTSILLLIDIIVDMDCILNVETVQNILNELNDQFPTIGFNTNIDYIFSSQLSNIMNNDDNISFEDGTDKAGSGVLGLAVSSAIAGQDEATQFEVLDALNEIGCGGSDSSDGNGEEEDCLNVLMNYMADNNVQLTKVEQMKVDSMLTALGIPCGDAAAFHDAICGAIMDIKIDELPSFVNCESYNCVFDYLTENSNAEFCNTLGALFDSDDYTVQYTTHSTGADGATNLVDAENGLISISFHEADCNNSDLLFIAETLLHEGQHAAWYGQLLDSGLDTENEVVVQQHWNQYAADNFGITYSSQHEAMVEEYMNMAAEFLWNLNNQQGTIEHYMYYVYEGLSHNPALFSDFSDEVILDWKNKHDELNDSVTGFNTFGCN